MNDFDWTNHVSDNRRYIKPFPLSIISAPNETDEDRVLRMLIPMSHMCTSCSMCARGVSVVEVGNMQYDPHVYSSMNYSKFILVKFKPTSNEFINHLVIDDDFIKSKLSDGGVNIDDIYITNLIKCYSRINDDLDIAASKCKLYVNIEINLLRPRFIVLVGKDVFKHLCDGYDFNDSVSKIIKLKELKVSAFIVDDESADFGKQLNMLAKLILAVGGVGN